MKGQFNMTNFLLIIVVLSLSILSLSVYADWQKTFGGAKEDSGQSVQQTKDGGYIIVGRTSSFGTGRTDVYLIKTENSGKLQWQKTFGGKRNDVGRSMQQTRDGGYIIVGTTSSFEVGICDGYLVKTDSKGKLLWQKVFGGVGKDAGYSVQQTKDGGYIITGGTHSFKTGYSDIYLVKTDSLGNIEWQKTFGGKKEDYGRSVKQTKDGGYIIVGTTKSFGAGICDVYFVKTDALGNLQWQKKFGGTVHDYGYSVQQTKDGGYIITGSKSSFGANGVDVFLIKTDSKGNKEWAKTFGNTRGDYGYSVQQTKDGGYIIAGYRLSPGNRGKDVYLIKTDLKGDKKWQKIFGGANWDEGISVQQTKDEGYIITGYTRSFGIGGKDVYLIKTGAFGFGNKE